MAPEQYALTGSLADTDLRRIILGECSDAAETLLDAAQAERLAFFAAVHGIVSQVRAQVHHLDWRAPFDMQIERYAAQEIMGWFNRMAPEELGQRLTPIRIRAAARAARRQDDRRGDRRGDVKVHRTHRPYLNFFAVEERDLSFRQLNGQMSDVLNRGGLMVGQACVVLPYDPVADTVLLIEQFRAPVFMMGDPNPWIWEPVAGLVDPGETPEQAAHREAMEEAGLTLNHLERAGGVYSSTGASGEYLNLFIGLTRLDQPAQTGGLASEGEDIRSKIIPFDALMHAIDADEYVDMPLVTCALWLARHRARLQA